MLSACQNFMLLPLAELYVPKDITDMLAGIRYFTLSFAFMSFKDVPPIKQMYDSLDTIQPDYFLIMLDVYNNSVFIYLLPIILTFGLVCLVHTTIFLISKTVKASKEGSS